MDMNYVVSFLEKIVNIPSPSGYTKEVMKVVEEEAKGFGYGAEYSRKGGLIITVPGKIGHWPGNFGPCGYLRSNGAFGYFRRKVKINFCWRIYHGKYRGYVL